MSDHELRGLDDVCHSGTKVKGPNPKEAMGASKAPMNACPNTALVELYNVMGGGAHKYGLYNFRETDISAMTYIGAIRRHFMLWEDGQDNDPESGMSHLAHIMACCALAIDAGYTGKLIDDRSKTGLLPGILGSSADTFAMYKQKNKSVEQREQGITKEKLNDIFKEPPVIPVIPLDHPWYIPPPTCKALEGTWTDPNHIADEDS